MTPARLLRRPILGGVFGSSGRYALASLPPAGKSQNPTRYAVIEPRAGTVLSIADDKVAALSMAREVLKAAAEVARRTTLEATFEDRQSRLWVDEMPIRAPPAEKRPRPISRRRRDVFEKSRGQCHYCATTLTLDGKWHVEHQVPQSLGGADEIGNLVAACVPCNLAKRDRTAIEFVADRNSAQRPAARSGCSTCDPATPP